MARGANDMIILLDTSAPVCKLTLIDNNLRHEATWEAHRELAKGLLGFLEHELGIQKKAFSDISGIGVYRGPGSFTGLRIGLTVLNTLADGLSVPIIGETGEDWQTRVVDRLSDGEDQKIVLPLYASEAHITKPRK